MYNIELYGIFIKITKVFHYFGMWKGNDDDTTIIKRAKKFFTLIYFICFVISLAAGGYLSKDIDESIFLLSTSVLTSVLMIKLYYMCWHGKTISAFLHYVSRHSISDHNEFIQINNKLANFVKFAKAFMLMPAITLTILSTMCLPVFSSEKNLPFNIGFPLDWKASEISYWTAYTFVVIGIFMTFLTTCFNVIFWYIMLNCSIKYQLLGTQFRKIGEIKSVKTITVEKSPFIVEDKKQKVFIRELIGFIKTHQNIQELIGRVKSHFSTLLLLLITTSGILICASVYVLAFSRNATLLQSTINLATIFYNFFDIFMIMNFGNEIRLHSERLSYSLFESNWSEQSITSKKYVIILMEILKQPHELVICKLYRLNLGTFTSILNLAYSMFNILKKFK